MEFLRDALLVVHFIFLAALVGGYFVAATHGGRVNPILQWGARIQLIVGIALYGVVIMLASDAGWEPDHMKFGIKGLVALVVVALIEIASAAQNRAVSNVAGSAAGMGTASTSATTAVPRAALVHVAGVLAILNIVIAVFM